MPRRDQGSKPTPKGFRYYRQGLSAPNVIQGRHRRGTILGGGYKKTELEPGGKQWYKSMMKEKANG